MPAERSRPDVHESAASETAETLAWRVWLLGRHPWKGLLAFAVAGFTVWFTLSLSGSAWLGGFAAFVLFASLSHFFLPTSYRLDAEAVRVSNLLYWRRRAWSEFRGFARSGPRLKLLTLPPGSRLDNYRGMLLILPDEAEAAVDFIRARLDDGADPGEPS